MNPSRYRLPNKCSLDRQRGRRGTLILMRERYRFTSDTSLPGNPTPEFRLPAYLKSLPRNEQFNLPKKGRLLAHKLVVKANNFLVGTWGPKPASTRDYERLLRLIDPPPLALARWRSDAEFGRQRLRGVNPMAIRGATTKDLRKFKDLVVGADEALSEPSVKVADLCKAGRLYMTEYAGLWDERIQAETKARNRVVAAATCMFYVDGRGKLLPLAIQLKPPTEPDNPVFTPRSGPGDWLMARSHAQACDAHYHEAVYHLLETHMVSELIAVAAARQLHPDHPLSQMLTPHFEFNLAIDNLARRDLLGIGGPIDLGLAAGVAGGLDAARLVFQSWKFNVDGLPAALKERRVDDPVTLPDYFYRDDGLEIWHAIHEYVERIIGLWYADDGDVIGDYEVQNWANEIATTPLGALPGFPARLESREQLVAIVREVIFRCGPQHAAVNNGQFDHYGFIPNSPGLLDIPLPGSGSRPTGGYTEEMVMKAMPSRLSSLGQLGMAWVLSEPTHRSILRSGECDAFSRENSFEAAEIVGSFRSRLDGISEKIYQRNRELEVPYLYLDPKNIARSTGT